MTRRPRTGREPLNRERVLRAAIDVADAEGLDAVTMRRVGQALGVEAMSLYNHVDGKDALLDGMADLLVGEIETPPADVEWKEALRRRAWSGRATVRRHPWAPALFAARPQVRLPMVAYLDGVTGCLLGAGFSPQLAHTAVHVLDSRVLGFTRDLFDPGVQGMPDPALLEAMTGGALPHSQRIMAEAVHDDDVEFAFGLDLILDGLERARDSERSG
ncbi:MAG: TetR/AcrR family transcriptional regulator C-terminal domain-containing protein [Chloroflexi bacterium]|jgi:AcrR family transcriptional regulator|nr:TetR/AcrR family transcriptional regulator C-terminal domain-containing protein [Chloroflexota bacterium]